MKRFLPFLIVVAVALITFGGGFALYRSKKSSAPPAPKDAPASGIHVRGSNAATALVTLEEFGDFQCPPCSMMAEALKKIEAEYGDRLKMIFHHFPLPIHAHAREAAIAVEAADKQGRFWEMHDMIYKEQAEWSKAPDVPSLFNLYAGKIGLDVERFKKDLLDPALAARVDADHDLGASRGVTSTPTLFVNGVALKPDATNPQGLHKAIDEALKKEPTP
jgi:protein-disulfide isomerase